MTRRCSRSVPTLALVFLLGLASPLGAQLLVGTVSDAENHRPVEEAIVRLLEPGGDARATGTTDRRGRFHLESPQLGLQDILVVERLGYQTQRIQLGDLPSFSVAGLRVDLEIPPEPLVVEGLVATVESERLVPYLVTQGFYERQRKESGEYILVDEDMRNRALVPSDLLRGVQGVSLDRRPDRRLYEPRIRRSRGDCLPAIVVDGAIVRRSGTLRNHIVEATAFDEVLNPNHIQAMEVYGTIVPPRWGGSVGRCGVILVWTR